MLRTHKTTILCQFGLIICHSPTYSYLNQFSSIFGGNCINPASYGNKWGGGGLIIADAKEVECGVLLNWIRAALTAQSSTATSHYTRLALPPRAVERGLPPTPMLQAHHWEVIRTDLPSLDPSRLAPPDQMSSLVDVLRLENAATRQDQVEVRARAAAPKTRTSAFPQFATIWRRNLGWPTTGGCLTSIICGQTTPRQRGVPISKRRSMSWWRVA